MTSVSRPTFLSFAATRGLLAALAFAAGLSGCASYAPPTTAQAGAIEMRRGVVEQITAAELPGPQHAGVGAVIGGIAGAGLGNLIGHGNGRAVATVLGTLGGGLLGNEVQQADYDRPIPAQQVVVRVDNGVIVAVTQPVNPALYPGMRVYLEGSGTTARVVPRG